jgi:hypothetical protein
MEVQVFFAAPKQVLALQGLVFFYGLYLNVHRILDKKFDKKNELVR